MMKAVGRAVCCVCGDMSMNKCYEVNNLYYCMPCFDKSCRVFFPAEGDMTREQLLEFILREVLKQWRYDAEQGDGIMETDYELYNRAMSLVYKDYRPD
jgi:hypothetical protein